MIIRDKPASTLDVERYLRRSGFTSHPSERSWYVREGARVTLRRASGGPGLRITKIGIHVHNRATGDSWRAHLEDAPLWAIALLLDWQPEPGQAGPLPDDEPAEVR